MSDRGVYNLAGKPSSGRGVVPTNGETEQKKTYLEFYSSQQCLHYKEPPGTNMVGEYHLQKGAYSMLVGPTGVGKSRGAMSLAVSLINGKGSWFGLPVHGRARVLLLQAENSRGRISRDLKQSEHLLPEDHADWLHITAPPKYGMRLDHQDFRAQLRNKINEFLPGAVIVDPLNAVIPDQMAHNFHDAFNWFGEVLADCADNIAILLIHHLRKLRADDQVKGRGILNLVAGSLLGVSVPRTVMIMQHASDDLCDRQVVFATYKNNDGTNWQDVRSAWELRGDGLFHLIEDFDFELFDGGHQESSKIKIEHLRSLFSNGEVVLGKNKAARELAKLAEVSRSTAYRALKIKHGPFAAYLCMTPDEKLAFSEPDPNQQHLKRDEDATCPQA
jgi:hypothetical protein